MEVIRLTTEQKSEYADFVTAHSCGSFLQSWSWGEFQTSQGKVAIRYGIYEQETLIGTAQLLQTKIPRLPGYYLYIPYGPLFLETVDLSVAIPTLLEKIKNDFSNSWFIRVEPNYELPIDGKPSMHIQPGSTLITDITLPEEDLLKNMHPKTRYNIKVADKHGVSIDHSDTEKIDDALNLIVGTAKRQNYRSQAKEYYKELLQKISSENLDCKINLYKASYQEKIISAAITVDHGSTRTYLFGGSNNEFRNIMAPYALHWIAIQDAKLQGIKNYDWWGTETATGKTPGFVQFKLRWGGAQKFYPNVRDIILNTNWYKAYTALRKINRWF